MSTIQRIQRQVLAATAALAVGIAFAALPLNLDPASAGFAKPAFAKHGADDPAGHDKNDDKGGKRNKGGKGRGGHDDGPNHTSNAPFLTFAKNGADDGANHNVGNDKGGKKGGKGRGTDDAANHASIAPYLTLAKNGAGRGGRDDGPKHA